MKTKTETLAGVLDSVFRFHYNAGVGVIFEAVYGPGAVLGSGYLLEKEKQIRDRGFASWYCDLDLENRRVVAKLMLERYPELNSLLAEDEGVGFDPAGAAEQHAKSLFHELWGESTLGGDYNKDKWMDLQMTLHDLGVNV